MKKTLIALTCVILAVACNRVAEQPTPQAPPKQKTLADYTATTLDGKPFNLRDAGNRVRLVNVWATWCVPCREEIPHLKTLHQQYAKRNFEVVGISIDLKDAIGTVRDFVAEQQINYPVVLDPDGRIMMELDTLVVPTSILLNRSGEIVWKHVGMVAADDEKLIEALNSAL